MSIYDTLNEPQRQAVFHTEGPLLILAGAGSGKTRVLTHRIAYLIGEKEVNPWNILAITFTNKAAEEMRERVDQIVGFGSESIWVSTFHSTCVRILRRYIDRLGYDNHFAIYDTDDQKTLMKDICKRLNVDTKVYKERSILAQISHAKDNLTSPDEMEMNAGGDYNQKKIAGIYREYQAALWKNNALDFDDLIVKTVELFQNCGDVLEYYQERFRYIMVDEYQDTNTAQFKLISLLASRYENLCVVGDDDQSIYKFRGAEIQNILNFPKIFAGTKIVRLESNYRSTSEILALADNVIRNNSGRLGKTLHAERGSGKTPVLAFLPNQDDEVHFCADLVQKSHGMGVPYSDWAILYRTNAQSLGFESEFVRKKIPYMIVGSLKFFEREEVKDIVAWLELIANHKNEIAFHRIINKPARGIGNKTQDNIVNCAQKEAVTTAENGSLVQNFEQNDIIAACRYMTGRLSGKSKSEVAKFTEIIEEIECMFGEDTSAGGELAAEFVSENSGGDLKKREGRHSLAELIEAIAKKSGLAQYYEERDKEEHSFRTENIQELANSAVPYPLARQGLLDFLDNIQLDRTLSKADEDVSDDAVTLITLHNTKGLEFNRVVMTGMEEGMFPRNGDDEEEMEEERRLCYVGITRAKNELYLTSCASRRMYGHIEYMKASPFLLEMGNEGVKAIGHLPSSYRQTGFHGGDYGERGLSHPDVESDPIKRKYSRGTKIYHDEYGYGIIANTTVNDEGEYGITVSFENSGIKRFLPKYQESQLMVVKD